MRRGGEKGKRREERGKGEVRVVLAPDQALSCSRNVSADDGGQHMVTERHEGEQGEKGKGGGGGKGSGRLCFFLAQGPWVPRASVFPASLFDCKGGKEERGRRET